MLQAKYQIPCKCPVCGEIRYYKRAKPVDYCFIRRCRYCARPKTIGKRYINCNGYVVIQTENGREYEHRYVWQKYYGSIPEGYVIHHKNHNKADNRIENLELLPKRKHDFIETKRQWEKRHNGILPPIKRPNRKDLDKKLLEGFLAGGLSIRKIASIFDVSHETVKRNIRYYQLESLVTYKPRKKINISKSELIDALEQARSMIGAAKLLDISYDSVKKYMKIYEIPPLPRNLYKKQFVDKETLLSTFKDVGSLRKVANVLGLGRNVVRRFAREYGIY